MDLAYLNLVAKIEECHASEQLSTLRAGPTSSASCSELVTSASVMRSKPTSPQRRRLRHPWFRAIGPPGNGLTEHGANRDEAVTFSAEDTTTRRRSKFRFAAEVYSYG